MKQQGSSLTQKQKKKTSFILLLFMGFKKQPFGPLGFSFIIFGPCVLRVSRFSPKLHCFTFWSLEFERRKKVFDMWIYEYSDELVVCGYSDVSCQ